MNNAIESLFRANIRRLSPYSTARDELQGSPEVFLDANESPYPSRWNRYPDPRQKALKEAVSKLKGIDAGRIFLGNGSDEAIDLMYRIFCEPGRDNAVAIAPSYGMYEVAAAINDVEFRKVLLGEDFALPSEELLNACDDRTKLLWICSPNNPTGNAFPRKEILRLAARFSGITVVDEAYSDFSSEGSLLEDLADHPRLVVLQTFSKARGMAALRLGMAFADSYIINMMSRVKYPYNISGEVQTLALEALGGSVEAQVEEIKRQRERLEKALPAFSRIRKVYPSDANFILAEADDADALYSRLINKGIIVRNRSRVEGCRGCLRITVGTPQENDRLLKELEEYEKSNLR